MVRPSRSHKRGSKTWRECYKIENGMVISETVGQMAFMMGPLRQLLLGEKRSLQTGLEMTTSLISTSLACHTQTTRLSLMSSSLVMLFR